MFLLRGLAIVFVAARLAGLGKGAESGFDEIRWNFREKARRRGAAQAILAVAAAINGAGESERALGARHADVEEPALFLDFGGRIDRAAVREQTFLKAGEEDGVEFEALGAV